MKQRFGIASMALVSILSTFGSSAAPAAPVRSLDRINPRLAALGLPYRLARVEWITDSGKLGQVILFNDRGNGQFPSHWVPFDPDRSGLADIFTIIDGADGATSSGLTEAETTAAIERAFQSWEDVQCSTIPITNLGSVPIDLGVVQALTGLGGTLAVLADITHAGFVPQAFFDLFFPVSDVVIAATFTFDFLGGSGNPTDINNDGKADTAFRETYYNDARDWAIDDDLDVETAALHETGHGLSQAHFGRLTYVESNGTFHFSPRAVMNAGYTGIQQLTGHDVANHCSIWSSWPIK